MSDIHHRPQGAAASSVRRVVHVIAALVASAAATALVGGGVAHADSTPPAASSYGQIASFGGFDAARYASGAYTGQLTPGKFVDPYGFAVDSNDPSAPDDTAIWVLDRTDDYSSTSPTAWRLQKLSDTGAVLGTTTFTTPAATTTQDTLAVTDLTVDPFKQRVYAVVNDLSNNVAAEVVAWSTQTDNGIIEPAGGGLAGSTDIAGASTVSTATQLNESSDPIDYPQGLVVDGLTSSGTYSSTVKAGDIAIEGRDEDDGGGLTVYLINPATGAEDGEWTSLNDTTLNPTSGTQPTSGNDDLQPSGLSIEPDGSLLVSFKDDGGENAGLDAVDLAANLSTSTLVATNTNVKAITSPVGMAGTLNQDAGAAYVGGMHFYNYDSNQTDSGPALVALSGGDYAGDFVGSTNLSTTDGSTVSGSPYAAGVADSFHDYLAGDTPTVNEGVRLSDLNQSGQLTVLGTLGNKASGGSCSITGDGLVLAAGRNGAVWVLTAGLNSADDGALLTSNYGDNQPAAVAEGGRQVIELAPGAPTSSLCPGVSGYFTMTDSGNSSNVSSVAAGASGPSITIPKGDSVKFDARTISYGDDFGTSADQGFNNGAPLVFQWDTNGPNGPSTDGYNVTNDWSVQTVSVGSIWPSPLASSTPFTSPGVYTVGLQLYGDYGTADQIGTVVVQDSGLPTAAFTLPSPAWAGQSLTFDASGSKSSSSLTSITSYTWSWGDGQSDQTTSSTDTHRYSKPGTYTVQLTIQQSDDQSASVSHTITVTGAPTAALSASSGSVTAGQSVSFNAGASVVGSGSTISKYAWSFGDGATDSTTTASDSHVYNTPGTYTAQVTVIDADGQSNSAQVSVTVTAAAVTQHGGGSGGSGGGTGSSGNGGGGGPVGSLSVSSSTTRSGASVALVLGAAGQVNAVASAKVKVVERIKGKRRVVTKTVSVWRYSKALGAGVAKLTLTPSAATKALLKKGALKVTVVITYTPSGGKAITKTVTVTLPKTKKAKAKH